MATVRCSQGDSLDALLQYYLSRECLVSLLTAIPQSLLRNISNPDAFTTVIEMTLF